MANQQDWTTEFYRSEEGKSPVEEFLKGLDDKSQARFIWAIQRLQVENERAGEPLVKHLEGKLWELRRASNGNIYRLLYFFFSGRKIVFVHGFHKKTQKIPRREIELAQKRIADYISRKGGD